MPKHSNPHQISEIEEAKIKAQIADDPDDFEPTDEELASAKPFAEVFPKLAGKSIRRHGPEKKKEAVSIRIDLDILEKLRASGSGWQSRVNTLLRKHLEEV